MVVWPHQQGVNISNHKDYLALMTRKYREAVEFVLFNDTDFIGADFLMLKSTEGKSHTVAEKVISAKK